MHHLQEIEGMSLSAVEYCVFDEADRLFEMGFADQMKAILAKLSQTRQTLLFSATLPKGLAEFARAGLKEPEFVRLDADSKLSSNLSLSFFTVRQTPCHSPQLIGMLFCLLARGAQNRRDSQAGCRKEDKVAALIWLVRELVKEGEPTIVFASTRHHVEFLHLILQAAGVSSACVYGAMDQASHFCTKGWSFGNATKRPVLV